MEGTGPPGGLDATDGTGATANRDPADGAGSTGSPNSGGGTVADRRTVLLGLAGLSAGCTTVLPESTPPDAAVRRNPPTLLCEGAWNGSRVTVTVAAGNALTGSNTERLTVYGDDALADWVGGENASQDFPLEPGDSITLTLDRGEDRIRVVWFDADSGGSSTLCTLDRSARSQGGT